MNMPDLLNAILKLGIPMVLLSWTAFVWLFNNGDFDRTHGRKEISASLKSMKAAFKTTPRKERRKHFLTDKWMRFGGGFYGLAGLWTFSVIEVSQLFDFLFNYPGLDYLLRDGFIGFVVAVAINQLVNVIEALLWFSWWEADSILLWVAIAWVGFWLGVELARRQREKEVLQHASKWKSRFAASSIGRRSGKLVNSLRRHRHRGVAPDCENEGQ